MSIKLPKEVLDYLCVDKFLRTMVDARVLKTALELGLVDYLNSNQHCNIVELGKVVGVDPAGISLLLGMLGPNNVVITQGDQVQLHPDFVHALNYRDLLESRLEFSGITLNDFADLFTTLVKDPSEFMGGARLFELFDYRRCFEYTDENYIRTFGWMKLTTALTEYEAAVCAEIYDFSQHTKMLDVGGNSGEFVRQICRLNPKLAATVFDLPLVCEIGMEHVLPHPEHSRISFVAGDLRNDPLPEGYDLISFKSMLHDWPEAEATGFLEKAMQGLKPGGKVMIFERLALEFDHRAADFSILPILLFFRSYRTTQFYIQKLASLGFEDINTLEMQLDSRFALITARKC